MSVRQFFVTWLYRWQFMHCSIVQFLMNFSHCFISKSSRSSSISNRFVIYTLSIFMCSVEYNFLSFRIFVDYDIFLITNFECSWALTCCRYAIVCVWLIVFMWFILTSLTRTWYVQHRIVIESLSLLMISSFFYKMLRIFADFACILIASLINRVTSRIFFASFWSLFIMSFVNMISKFFFSTTSIMITMNSRVYQFLSELETVFFAILIIDVKICTRSIVLRIIFE
jgi:hypothetical protein